MNHPAILAVAVSLAANHYTTNFPLTENPLSENRIWINGKDVGMDWAKCSYHPAEAFCLSNKPLCLGKAA